MRKIHTWDYDFVCDSYTDYNMKLTFKAEKKLFKSLFEKTLIQLRKKNIEADGDMEIIEKIELEERYFPLIKNFVRKPVRITQNNHLNPDNIYLISYDIEKVVYLKKNTEWDIDIHIKGQYIRK